MQLALRNSAAFTLIEIAICLAIIGFALVAIIGVLPLGMNAQRANREETVINQDATVWLNAIREGAQGLDYLTNYVYAVTNSWTLYAANGSIVNSGQNGYTYGGASITSGTYPGSPYANTTINYGAAIINLLSTPEFIANIQNYPQTNYPAVPYLQYAAQRYGSDCYSNHVVAYVHSISGLAAEKPPQDNQIMREDTFSYRLYCVNAPIPVDTNTFNPNNSGSFATQLAASQRELRLTFLWPQLPNGKVGFGRQTFRVTIAGQLMLNDYFGQWLYFYQPQTFTNSIP